jgi:hypothetical protein
VPSGNMTTFLPCLLCYSCLVPQCIFNSMNDTPRAYKCTTAAFGCQKGNTPRTLVQAVLWSHHHPWWVRVMNQRCLALAEP